MDCIILCIGAGNIHDFVLEHCYTCLYLWTYFLCGLVLTTSLFTWSRFIFLICHLLKSFKIKFLLTHFCTIVCTYYFEDPIIWNSLVVEGVVLCRINFCEGTLNFKIIWTIDADQSLMVDFETRSLIFLHKHLRNDTLPKLRYFSCITAS